MITPPEIPEDCGSVDCQPALGITPDMSFLDDGISLIIGDKVFGQTSEGIHKAYNEMVFSLQTK